MSSDSLSFLQVLVVDDIQMIRTLVSDVLVSLGFKDISVASSGREAMAMVSKKKFDFIISDWQMPDLDGIDLVRFVRQIPDVQCASVPIIMLTANTEAKHVITALKNGINGYLIKPFTAEQLARRIRNAIEHPRQFVIAPTYRGPDRRYIDKGPPGGIERRVGHKNYTGRKEK